MAGLESDLSPSPELESYNSVFLSGLTSLQWSILYGRFLVITRTMH